MNSLISIIIPVYNTSKYLDVLFSSLKRQTYSNLEIIFVDDCSTDNSLELLKKYTKEDDRAIIIQNSENKGSSFSRNEGLKIAKGDWIGFVDSDDHIKLSMYENLIKIAILTQTDIVCCGIIRVDEETGQQRHILNPGNITLYSPEEAICSWFWEEDIGYSVYSKLWKRELWDNIEFPVGENFEDAAVLPYLFQRSKGISHTGTYEYYYYCRPNSITTSLISEKNLVIYPRIEKIELFIQTYFPNIYQSFKYFRLVNYSNLFIKAQYEKKYINKQLYQKIKHEYNSIFNDIFSLPSLSIKDRLRLLLLRLEIYYLFKRR